jgi:DnaA-homolog protein
MEQLILELKKPEPPDFDNFVAGPNREVVAALRRLAAGDLTETGILVWGGAGVGKSHLLKAVVASAAAAGRPALYVASPALVNVESLPVTGIVCVDAINRADEATQGALFTLYNRLAAGGGHLLASSSIAPARLTLRDDLRTRLAHGLVYEVAGLHDADKAQAIAAYAEERGFRLTREVIDYLLAHGRRDMATLVATLAALDRHSLATKRAITVPLLREWMRRQPGERGRPSDVIH